ncbi:MAG: DEAD/DEAH box helicase [Bacilli bacterium]
MFGYKNGQVYCRACIKFKGKKAKISKYIKAKLVSPQLKYSLSKNQEKVAAAILEEKQEVYINAVCGSGKTEMVFKSIDAALAKGYRVGFVIPRREVVKEIHSRLKEVYPKLQITLVYGGHNEYLDGDIIVLTAHQCHRYQNKFGLLILDEYDAFPLKGDETLLRIVKRTCYGKKIYLSATFSEEELFGKAYLELRKRYHQYDLPIPRIILGNRLMLFLKLLAFIHKNKARPKIIFVPTIKGGEKLQRRLRYLLVFARLFTSESSNKTALYRAIKAGKYKTIIATTILERGITIKDLQVAVFGSEHPIFDYRTLIQIEGRVGRKKETPMGQVIFFATEVTKDMERAINEIVDKNNCLRLS